MIVMWVDGRDGGCLGVVRGARYEERGARYEVQPGGAKTSQVRWQGQPRIPRLLFITAVQPEILYGSRPLRTIRRWERDVQAQRLSFGPSFPRANNCMR
jgi:hypothetical protein